MNESFSAFVRVLTAVLWGPHVLLLILLAGVWFTLRGRFMQVTKLPGMTRGALCGTQRCGGFSAFQSLTASLAGSLGTGNILGVAAAILVGGAGAVVWMWIAAFLSLAEFTIVLYHTPFCAPILLWARISYISGCYNKGCPHCRSPPSDFDFAYQLKNRNWRNYP